MRSLEDYLETLFSKESLVLSPDIRGIDLFQHVRQAEAYLLARELKPGDTVSIFCTESLHFHASVLACLRRGIRPCLIEAHWPSKKLAKLLKKGEVKTLLSDSKAFYGLRIKLGIRSLAFRWLNIENRKTMSPDTWPECPTTLDMPGLVLSTSGTTGDPKLCLFTKKAFEAQLNLLYQHRDLKKAFSCFRWFEFIQLLCGCHVFSHSTLRSLDLDKLKDFRASDFFLNDDNLLKLLQSEKGRSCLASCEKLSMAGSELRSKTAAQALKALAPNAEIENTYGFTELLPISKKRLSPMELENSATQLGKILWGNEAQIRNSKGEVLKNGERGELWVRGPQMLSSYLGRESDVFDSHGFFKSSDWALIDECENLHIYGRIEDQFSPKISPIEVEEKLRKVPGLQDVAVTTLGQGRFVLHILGPESQKAELNEALSRLEIAPTHIQFWKTPFPKDKRHQSKILRKELNSHVQHRHHRSQRFSRPGDSETGRSGRI